MVPSKHIVGGRPPIPRTLSSTIPWSLWCGIDVRPDGRVVRHHVHVRKSSLVGLGKEGTKLAARMKLGKAAAADPSFFID